MKTTLDKVLAGARLRHDSGSLLRRLGWMLLAAGGVACLISLAWRLLGVDLVSLTTAAVLLSAAVAAAIAWWLLTRPSRLGLALMVDQRLALKERFSTALAIRGDDDPFARAACQEAQASLTIARIRQALPIRLLKPWMLAGVVWAAAAALFVLVPTTDLLGLVHKKDQKTRQEQQLAQVKADLQSAVSQVQSNVQQLGDAQLAKELAGLESLKNMASPQDARRAAIEKFGKLEDRLKELQHQPALEQAQLLKQMLSQLKTGREDLDRRLSQAIAQGDFNQAQDILKQLQQQLQDGKLTEQQKEQLAHQAANLAEQLQKIAAQQQAMREELSKAGADPSLADKSLDDLKKTLQDQGLSQEQIDKLLEKAKQCQGAGQDCKGLAEALKRLGADGELSDQDLEQLAQELKDLQLGEGQLELVEGALERCEGAIAALGEGDQEGDLDQLILAGEGQGQGQSGVEGAMNLGGPGGSEGSETGHYKASQKDTPLDQAELSKTLGGRPTQKGPVVASEWIKGAQLKGQSLKEYIDAVGSGKDAAEQAVHENQIPKKYESAIKRYFGEIQPQSAKDGSQ